MAPSNSQTRPEIEPPWVKYPNYPPGDMFWRQTGEVWFHDVWKAYWDGLSADDQRVYLEKWKVPDVWRMFYFNPEFDRLLEQIDQEDGVGQE